MPRKNAENAIQTALIRWVRDNYPQVDILCIRNEDMRFRANEIDKGHPDLHFEVRHNNQWFILKLELKTKNGRLSAVQNKWNDRFDSAWGYNRVRGVAYGFTDAKRIFSNWISRFEA